MPESEYWNKDKPKQQLKSSISVKIFALVMGLSLIPIIIGILLSAALALVLLSIVVLIILPFMFIYTTIKKKEAKQ